MGVCLSTLSVQLQVRDVRVRLGGTVMLVLRPASRERRESTYGQREQKDRSGSGVGYWVGCWARVSGACELVQ